MSHVLVIGAGPLGRAATVTLVGQGHEVTVVSRSGTALPGAATLVADVTGPRLADTLPAADAIVVCCNFPYGQWQRHWPPAIANLIDAAESSGAVLVLAGNLYAYGPSSEPLREDRPLAATYDNGRTRAEVWRAVARAHDEGRIRAVEVRGSDYIGPGSGQNAHGGDRLLDPLLAGRTAWVVGDPDVPHAWTATADFGALLARATEDERMWGRAWHVPNAPACSIRELAREMLRAAGREEEPRVRQVPRAVIRTLGLVSPTMRGINDVSYQFTAPFLVDDDAARHTLGVTHTPLASTLGAAVAVRHGVRA